MVPEGIKFALFCKSGLPQVQKNANFMAKGAIFRKECKKVIFNIFLMIQFSYLDQLSSLLHFCHRNQFAFLSIMKWHFQ